MKPFVSFLIVLIIPAAMAQADSYEYVDIDALMQDVPTKKPNKSSNRHTEKKVKKQQKHHKTKPRPHLTKPHVRPISPSRLLRTPEDYVKYRYGRRWKKRLLRHGHHRRHARGHLRPKRGWVLAYAYDKAKFYDQYGFRYGNFNKRGFYFEGRYFRYTPRYTYHDRLRGRGYFDSLYYVPAYARRYGFCDS